MSCQQNVEWASGNIFIRPVRLKKEGEQVGGHTHSFDHTTILLSGSIRIVTDTGLRQDFKAPAHCLLKANIKHYITALEDKTEFWCVYSHRNPQGEAVQEFTGWMEAYS